jgi:vitamin B12 transport system permease protein
MSRPHPALSFVIVAFIAIMLGLAAGAVWMVASMYFRHPVPWLALPVGALLAWVIRVSVRRAGTEAAIMAALATLLAAIYVNILIAALEIAGSMGVSMTDALRTAGAGMLWQLARMSVTTADVLWLLPGVALAAWLAWWRPEKAQSDAP